jgi:hypothetical protein
MTKPRHIALWAMLTLVTLLLLISLYGGYRWQQFKQQQGIAVLDISGVRLSTKGLAVRHIVLSRRSDQGEALDTRIDDLSLAVDSLWRPLPLRSIAISRLQVDWVPPTQASNDSDDDDFTLPSHDEIETWARWLPLEGAVESLMVTLPCASGRCREQGQVRWQHAGSQVLPAELSITMARDTHRIALLANAYKQAEATHLDVQLQLDGVQRLISQNQLTPEGEASRWTGALTLSELPEAPWVLAWLGEWLDYVPPPLPELPEQMRVGAGWALTVDKQTLAGDWRALAGEVRLSANLPAPWPVVGVGQVQGRLDLTAHAENGVWIPTELSADLGLRPAVPLVEGLPPALRPGALSLKISPAAPKGAAQGLPLQLQLSASGPAPFTLDTRLQVKTAEPYEVSVEQARMSVRSAALALTDLSLKGLDTDLRFSGQLSRDKVALRLDKGSRVALGSLSQGSDLTASTLLLELAGLGVDVRLVDNALHGFTVKGKSALSIGELRQPALRSQGWRWSGTLNADQQQIKLDGPLSNDAGLTLPAALIRNASNGALRLNATLPDVFLRAGNPLAATIADWPQVLDLTNGRLQGQAQVDLPASGPIEATGRFSAKGIGGIYDRTELSGLDAELSVALQRNQLRLEIAELTVREANPGLTFGPLRFVGEYAGPVDALGHGRLAWTSAEVRLLGGRFWLDPGAADLAASSQGLKAHLRGLQLPLLLEAYPTEGLSGTGVIDGEMNVQRSEAGISIEQGSLKAREPGGALQFRSAKIQALGRSNPAMRLVTEALDDFHYDLLSSDVHYAADGTLNLGLKLHGRNPALEGGRPINFSINLEEDIPALLTSLQLSDRVSETIQRRVQERLK